MSYSRPATRPGKTAAAVTVTVWLLTRSDGQRGSFTYYDQNREFATARGAVIAICHADPANTPWDPERAPGLRYVQYDVHVQGGVPLIWKPLDDAQPRVAIPAGDRHGQVRSGDVRCAHRSGPQLTRFRI